MFDVALIRAVYRVDPADLTLREFNSLLHRCIDICPILNIQTLDEGAKLSREAERRMNNNI